MRIFCVYLCLCISVACLASAHLDAQEFSGAPAVSFSATTLDGAAVSIPLKDGTPALLVFWASWCGSCNTEAPTIVKLNKELNQRIRVIGVNVDEDSASAAPFVAKHHLTYASIADGDLKISEILKVEATPTLVLIDGTGKVLTTTTSLDKEMVEAIRSLLRKNIAKSGTQKKNKPVRHLTQVLARAPEQVVEQHASIMGTDIHILIHSQDRPKSLAAITAAMNEIRRIDDAMTDWRPIGQVWKINHNNSGQPLQVSEELLSVIQQAIRISEITDGLFDITYRGVGSLWNFYTEPHILPSPESIAKGLELVDYKKIQVNEKESTVFVPPGMEIGLGGIAKGYAVDRAVAIIDAHGFSDFVVNAGGDLYVRGSKEAQLWRVGISDPRKNGALIAEIPAKNYAIVTSGDYERFFIKDGKRYCHILNPKTGYPADACQSVTVLAKTSAQADALATGIFLMGPEKGLAFAESLESVEAFIIDAVGAIHMTKKFSQ